MGQAFRRAAGRVKATPHFDAPKTKPVTEPRIDPPRPADRGANGPGRVLTHPSLFVFARNCGGQLLSPALYWWRWDWPLFDRSLGFGEYLIAIRIFPQILLLELFLVY